MSFGEVRVDQNGVIDRYPSASMLTGLIGNALGYEHKDCALLQILQSQLTFACRWDVEPSKMVDYQTANLGQEHMSQPAWTTYGVADVRTGGSAKTGTHIRYQHYWVNGVMTVIIGIKDESLFQKVVTAIKKPARPLFIGRKCCIPSRPIYADTVESESLVEALAKTPFNARNRKTDLVDFQAFWSYEKESNSEYVKIREIESRFDKRDWTNQIHTGERRVCRGRILYKPET